MVPPSLPPRAGARFPSGTSFIPYTLLVLAAACTGQSAADAPLPAELVLLNGNVITVDAEDRVAQAVAIRDGKIVVVGSNSEVEPFLGPQTTRIELDGRTRHPRAP